MIVNTLRPERKGNILQMTFSNGFLWMKIIVFWFKWIPTDHESTLVQVMAWGQTGDKPFPEYVLSKILNAICHHWVTTFWLAALLPANQKPGLKVLVKWHGLQHGLCLVIQTLYIYIIFTCHDYGWHRMAKLHNQEYQRSLHVSEMITRN